MALIRKFFWIAIFLIATLSFIVLFEHGTTDFKANLTNQIVEFRKLVESHVYPPKKDDKVP